MANFSNKSYYLNDLNISNAKILLLLNNKRNTELLGRFLGNKYTTYTKYDKNIKFDLIIVDNVNYQARFSLMKDLKKAQRPMLLPLIFLHKREDAIDHTSRMMNIADEYILTPVKKDVLKNRINRLLKTRQLSKNAYNLNDKYENIFNNINDMIFLHKIDLKDKKLLDFIEVNHKVIDKLGYQKEELLKMKLTDLVYHKLRSPFFNYYFNKLKKQKKVMINTKMIKANDESLKVEINSKILTLDKKEVVLSVVRDVSHRKEKAEELNLEKLKVKKLDVFLDKLIYLSKSFSYYSEDNLEKFLTEILDVSYEYINKADSSYIAVSEDQSWQIIKMIGCDQEIVKKLNEKRDRLINKYQDNHYNQLIKINNLNPELYLDEELLDDLKDEFKSMGKQIKESIFFDLEYKKGQRIRLSLDISSESSCNFSENTELIITLFKNFLYVYINLILEKSNNNNWLK